MTCLIHSNLKYWITRTNLILYLKFFSRNAHWPITDLLKGPSTKQREIKKTNSFCLKIVVTENNDWTLWECIVLHWRNKILGE